MDHVKNHRGRSKFFTCFNPAFADEDPDRDSEDSFGRKKRGRRSFSAAMKAVFFKSSLAQIRNKKSRKDPFRSNSNRSSRSSSNEELVNTNKNTEEVLLRTNSDASSIFSPSVTDSSRSSSSLISSNSRSGSERIKRSASSLDLKQGLNPKRWDVDECGCTVGMCILLICLVALVFSGKVFAIAICTSACLLFAPGRRYQRRRLESAGSSIDVLLDNDAVVDSEEYKKRVILDGFLKRNRPRILQP